MALGKITQHKFTIWQQKNEAELDKIFHKQSQPQNSISITSLNVLVGALPWRYLRDLKNCNFTQLRLSIQMNFDSSRAAQIQFWLGKNALSWFESRKILAFHSVTKVENM